MIKIGFELQPIIFRDYIFIKIYILKNTLLTFLLGNAKVYIFTEFHSMLEFYLQRDVLNKTELLKKKRYVFSLCFASFFHRNMIFE